MCFPLFYCRVINDSWFKMTDIFSIMEAEVFVGVIRNKYVDRCSALDLMDTTNDVHIWVSSLCGVIIHNEVCHMFFNDGPTYLNWHNTIVSLWYLECQLNCAYCCLLITVVCVD